MDFVIGIALIWIGLKIRKLAKTLERVLKEMENIDPNEIDPPTSAPR